MALDKKTLDTAVIEAIYWWNRDEDYYHKYFSQIGNYHLNNEMMDFFTSKVFSPFLKEYSIRRNLLPGYDNVKLYLDKIIEFGFLNNVNIGNLDIIDEISKKVKDSGIGAKKGTVSLLSKAAFLVNPNQFSLYDSYAIKAIKNIVKTDDELKDNKQKSYKDFITSCNYIIDKNESQIDNTIEILNDFQGSPAEIYFKSNLDAFRRRVFDKYLWIIGNNYSPNSREINNSYYKEFYILGLDSKIFRNNQ